MSPRIRISFFVDEHLAVGLKSLKERDGATEAESIRRAIAEYLERKGVAGVAVKKAARKRAATRKRA